MLKLVVLNIIHLYKKTILGQGIYISLSRQWSSKVAYISKEKQSLPPQKKDRTQKDRIVKKKEKQILYMHI